MQVFHKSEMAHVMQTFRKVKILIALCHFGRSQGEKNRKLLSIDLVLRDKISEREKDN